MQIISLSNHTIRKALQLSLVEMAVLCELLKKRFYNVNNIPKALDMNRSTVIGIIKHLRESGVIVRHRLTDSEALLELGFNKAHEACCICGESEVLLHEHHYPIRRKDKGTKTIELCPNCHYKFHFLTDWGFYTLSDRSNKIISTLTTDFEDEYYSQS